MAPTNNAQASSSRHPIRRPARVQSSSPEDEDSDEERRKKPRISRTSADGVDLDGWTIDTYKPQTLKYDARSMEKLRTVMSNIENMRERIITSLGKVIDTAKTIEECNPGDKMIEELAQGLCRSIEISEVLEIKGQILRVMTAKFEKKEEIEEAVAKYEELAAQRTEEYMKKTPRQKFADDKHYRDFREGIWSVNNESSACWPMSHWLERQEGDASDDEDDEVQVGPTMQNYRCAISHMPIEDAMVNPLCGHHYSKAHVEGLFQQHHTGRNGRQKIKCPAVGCSKDVFLRDLKEDPAFQKKADEFHQRANEEEVDDFEDISQE